MKGFLALIGGEEFSDGFEDVHAQLLGNIGKRNVKVVYLPTCAADDGDKAIDFWCSTARQRLSALGAKVEAPRVVDRQSANNQDYARLVEEADWVYLGGGYPHVGMRILPGTYVLDAIYTAIQRGALLSGASGGAMLMCARSFIMTPEMSEQASQVWEKGAPPDWDPPLPPLIDCLGIVQSSFCAPNFNRVFPVKWLERGLLPKTVSVIGIDEQTALIRSNAIPIAGASTWIVSGRGTVSIFRDSQPVERYRAGNTVML